MKEGLIPNLRRILRFLVIGLLSMGPTLATPTFAVGPLEVARDVIGSMVPQRTNVSHDISFALPTSATQITPSDYILIDFPNYTSVTAPTAITGGFGTPTFSVSGQRAKITGVGLLPGTGITIHGITATNPPSGSGFQIIIMISPDSAGSIIRNQATVVGTQGDNYVTVAAVIESTLSSLHISGYTSPGAFVSLTESGSVVGTSSADGGGIFNFSMSGVNPGDHTYRIYATDGQNRVTSQSVLQLFLLSGALTNASGIILSPTIQLDSNEINPGDSLQIFGSTMPNSQVNIFTESPLRSYSATSDTNGDWTYTLDGTETTAYGPGEYRTYTIVQDGIGNQSIVSNTLTFTIKTPPADDDEPACDISHGDLNCDTKTNLTDFSILLFHWRTTSRKADINSDGNVTLTDFSIMMFYFRR
jgi:hypothetical protein